MRKISVVTAAATVLGGCASLSDHPEYQGLRDIPPVSANSTNQNRLEDELGQVVALGNTYLGVAKALGGEAQLAGGAVLGSAFYGAAVTAFRPAEKNLLAALLGAGAAQAWRSALKPGERARIYVKGYLALDCLAGAGGGLLGAGNAATTAAALRGEVDDELQRANRFRGEAERGAEPVANQAALLARLGALAGELETLDAALKVEQAAPRAAPIRIGQVRRQIVSNIDRLAEGAAPDYQAALKLIGETARPTVAGDAGALAAGPAPPPPPPGVREALPQTLQEEVDHLEGAVPSLKRRTPTLAADAYDAMGRCVEIAG